MQSRAARVRGQEPSPSREEGKTRRLGEAGATRTSRAADPSSPELSEIDDLRAETHTTRRVTVAALEEILYQPIPVLDHGFIRVVDYLGDDSAIVQAARVSYGKGTKKISNDRGLIRYLMRHRHTTPFEMCEIKLHVKLPIFVARQWIRHRTANVNEYSARYSILDREFYVPDRAYLDTRRVEQQLEKRLTQGQPDLFGTRTTAPKREELAAQSRTNRQGREGELSDAEADQVLRDIQSESNRAYTFYTKLLNETDSGQVIDPDRDGLARELARMVLPINYYTQWYWKIDLFNLLHFLSLRADPHAQYEIRAYAEVLCDIAEKWVPLTWEAFRDYEMTGAHVSGPGLKALRELLDETTLSDEEKLAELRKRTGMSPREFREFMDTLGRKT
ncbi:MAG: FAD-dependent thymidylate synthase [Alphaproteobacteria bacterium]